VEILGRPMISREFDTEKLAEAASI
jgi:outer membrane protein assembly factor BamE (lipoprotein component of BamABCDE complex)